MDTKEVIISEKEILEIIAELNSYKTIADTLAKKLRETTNILITFHQREMMKREEVKK